jgi:hypothetical protein
MHASTVGAMLIFVRLDDVVALFWVMSWHVVFTAGARHLTAIIICNACKQ